jgi:hypothetical protein
LNLFKKPAYPLGLWLKRGIFSTKLLKGVSFAITKMNSKKVSPRKPSVFFFCDVCFIIEDLGHDPAEWRFVYWLLKR